MTFISRHRGSAIKIFFFSPLFQNIKPKASLAVSRTHSLTQAGRNVGALRRAVLRADPEKAGGYLSFYMECGSGQSVMSSSQGCVILTEKWLTEPNPARLSSAQPPCPRTQTTKQTYTINVLIAQTTRVCVHSLPLVWSRCHPSPPCEACLQVEEVKPSWSYIPAVRPTD